METVITLNPTKEYFGSEIVELLEKPIRKNGSKKKTTLAPTPDLIIYPESDDNPMAENIEQFRWIRKVLGGLEIQYKSEKNIFVAGDLLWYPEEGNNTKSIAPDAMVAFGRKQDDKKGCYKQWEENGLAPQVVFEIWSPGNTKQHRNSQEN